MLSGAGSDGSRGIRAIHEAGGLIVAQDETARFDGMPRSAVDTGTVDLVLAPDAMAAALGRYLEHAGPNDRARATDSGFDRHILKPVEPAALFRVLREVFPSPDRVS